MAPAPSLALTSSSVTVSSCPQVGHNTNHNHSWNCQFRPTMPLKCTSLALGVTAQQLISHLGHPNGKIHCSVTSEFLHTAVSCGSGPAGNDATPLRNANTLLCKQLSEATVASFYTAIRDPLLNICHLHPKRRAPADSPLTCSIASVIEIDSEGPWLVSCLPRGRRAVFVVGVYVVVVHVLPSQHGGT